MPKPTASHGRDDIRSDAAAQLIVAERLLCRGFLCGLAMVTVAAREPGKKRAGETAQTGARALILPGQRIGLLEMSKDLVLGPEHKHGASVPPKRLASLGVLPAD